MMFENEAPFYSIIEVASNNDPEVVPEESERLLEFIDSVDAHIVEGLIPQGEAQAKTIWECRENLAPAAASYGLPLYFDVSLSSNKFYQCVADLREHVKNTEELSESERASHACVFPSADNEFFLLIWEFFFSRLGLRAK